MEVDDPDLDAFGSATRAQLRAREIGKIEALIPNLRSNAPVPEAMGKSSLENAPRESQCGTSSHEQSDLDESPEDLERSTEWIFQGYLFFGSDGWRTDEAYEAEVRAVVEQQYSAVSHCGGAALGILGGSDSMAARRLCRAVTGVPAAPFYGGRWQ